MRTLPLNRETLISRLEEIRHDVFELKRFQSMSSDEFEANYNFAIAEHFLRRAIEAIFDIGSHILSRIPGARAASYKEIAVLLGKHKVISNDYMPTLQKIAGYRNRMVHFYDEISQDELHGILQNYLQDIEAFACQISDLLKHPQEKGFEVE